MLHIALHVGTKDIGEADESKWIAMERQTGLIAFADTEEAAKARLKEIATFALGTLQEHGGRAAVDEYLTRHDVEWSEVPVTPLGAVLSVLPSTEPVFVHAG